MKLDITISGLIEAIGFFNRLRSNLITDAYYGMLDATGAISDAIDTVVPHRGVHLGTSGADYHIFAVEEYPNRNIIRCGPTAPYVPILEYGSEAVIGEFEPRYVDTKTGQRLIGYWFSWRGTRDTFWLRRHIPAFRYLERSINLAFDRVVNIIVEAVKRAVRRS